jgi:MYXO-CTERM domain-containing protein
MTTRSIIHGFLVGATLTVGYLPLAFADVPPPDGYVEQCTVQKKQGAGQTCVTCQNDYRSFATDAGDPCQEKYTPLGYTKICKAYGASVWSEVWCTGTVDAGTEPVTPTGSCNCRTAARHTSGSGVLLVMLGALASTRLLRRRALTNSD